MDLIPKIASRYKDIDQDDLAAELQIVLLLLRRKPASHVNDWRKFIAKSFWNKASKFSREWRKGRKRSLDVEPAGPTLPETRMPDPPHELIYRQLGNADRRMMKQLKACDWKISRLARRLGCHRNTIHRRMRQIAKTRSHFEIESATLAAGPLASIERSQLEEVIRNPSSPARLLLRARLILDLINGLDYQVIVRRWGTSSSTIARWRERFAKNGIAGLKARHPGRKPLRHSHSSRSTRTK